MKSRKTIFISLTIGSIVLLSAVIFLLWLIPAIGLVNIHPLLPKLGFAAVIVLLAMLFLGAGILTYGIISGREIAFAQRLRGIVMKMLYPIIVMIGSIFKISKEEINGAFADLNNQLVMSKQRKTSIDRLLVLLPHCIQYDECKVKITGDIHNCAQCGKCEIKNLDALSKRYNLQISVATGGGLAKRLIKEKRPEAVVAVACEKELAMGLKETYPLPVIAIPNERPYGYCINTTVDVSAIEKAILHFINK
ncbi:MAG: hypothetical protein A2Z50_04495 [Nitrospirae bacterium RBG_19FT_COMBO_42_15]|nr:MAG: hypothetical protein A2Z50_04495 [Nitrospirae bacterium RBG_19FT_COMBO_42_15]